MLRKISFTVNFDGFHDDESGIYGYMWAVGTDVCRNDVVDFQDPHAYLQSSDHWTFSGYQKELNLEVCIKIFLT